MGAQLSNHGSGKQLSNDAKVKIYNQLTFESENLIKNGIPDNEVVRIISQRHSDLVKLYLIEEFSCPKVRFGRTGLQMPILTLGGMRQQQTWSPKDGTTLEDINKDVQKNFEQIADRAMAMGINHFETARGYGTSELQYAPIIRKYERSSFILQTKVAPKQDTAEFRKVLEKSFSELALTDANDFVDLFSFHGINRPEHLQWIMQSGGNMEVVREYQAAGKIRFVGFSTHGMTPLIVEAIETDLFDYVNLHYHFCGSYTATGSGKMGGNAEALEAAKNHDMGVFIISPTDKGGALYSPSVTLYSDCLPLTPIAFHNLWLWSDARIHTIVIGAARPADFDEHLDAAIKYNDRQTLSSVVMAKLSRRLTATMGDEQFLSNWFVGLPDAYENPLGVGIGYLYWLYWITKSWGLYNYAQTRYASLEGNMKTWDDAKDPEENKKQFSWVPGLPWRPEQEQQIRDLLASRGVSLERIDHVIAALKSVHLWLHSGGCLKRNQVPEGVDVEGWKVAYCLQPDTPFPERG